MTNTQSVLGDDTTLTSRGQSIHVRSTCALLMSCIGLIRATQYTPSVCFGVDVHNQSKAWLPDYGLQWLVLETT
ncbi:hypothetical protein Bpfe_001759, partial [Biomphalaria pfeifferi]